MTYLISAGGVVYKKESDMIFILMCQSSWSHRWVFPKGKVGDTEKEESIQDAAIREVREESGATARIIAPLTPLTIWYTRNGEKTQKLIHYFLMGYMDGDINQHDNETSVVQWVPMDEIESRLKYNGDKSVWKEAREFLLGEVA